MSPRIIKMLGGLRTPCDAGVIHGRAPSSECANRAKPWVLATTIVGSGIAFIDASVVNVALPAVQRDLGGNVSDSQWIVNAYMLMLGALILVGGAAGDRFGRRRIFIFGVSLFTLASVACGLASHSLMLIVARAVQGVGGAFLVPSSLAMISATFPEKERGRAIGTWAAASAFTSALGPVLGGWLVDVWSWRLIFFVNVPVAVVALCLAIIKVPSAHGESRDAPIDWLGATLAAIGLGAITYGLTAVSEQGWHAVAVWGSLLVGVAILGMFLWTEARSRAPMMPLDIFRSTNFSGANAITLCLYFALGGALFFVPFELIRVQGYSAALTGAAFLPFSIVMGALSRWSGGLVERYGARAPLMIGPVIVACGFMLLARAQIGSSYWGTFFPAMIVLGLGMGVSVAPLTTTVMRSAGDEFAGVASGINNAVARVAGLLAVALLGAVAVGIFGSALNQRMEKLHLTTEITNEVRNEIPRLAEAQVPRQAQGAVREQIDRAIRESFVRSFQVIVFIAAALSLLSSLCAAVMIGPIKRAKPVA